MDLDPAFVLFINCPSVASLRVYFGGLAPADADLEQAAGAVVVPATVDHGLHDDVTAATRLDESHSQDLSQPLCDHQTVQIPTALSSNDNAAFDTALQIIAEESGIAIEDLTEETSFADIGKQLVLETILAHCARLTTRVCRYRQPLLDSDQFTVQGRARSGSRQRLLAVQ
jgi:hypothetical protein